MKEKLKKAFDIILIVAAIIAYIVMFLMLYELLDMFGIGADGS